MTVGGFLHSMGGVHLWSETSWAHSPELWGWYSHNGARAVPVSLWQHQWGGRGCLCWIQPHALPGDCSDSCQQCHQCPPGARAGAWPLTCPFILAGARVLMRERHLHAPSKVPFTLPPILCSLQRGLCNLCWQPGAQGSVCVLGGLCPPQP